MPQEELPLDTGAEQAPAEPQRSAGEQLVERLGDAAAAPQEATSPVSDTTSGGGSLRSVFEQRGYDVSGYQDDSALADALTQSYSDLQSRLAQASQYQPYAQKYVQHQKDFETWLAERQQQQAKSAEPAAPAAPEWGAPEYDPRWEKFSQFSPELGRWVLKEEARGLVGHDVADKLDAYKNWERDTAQKMVRDFPSLVKEQFEPLAKQIEDRVNAAVQQQIASLYKRQSTVSALQNIMSQYHGVLENLQQRDQQGNPLFDQMGRPIPTQLAVQINQVADRERQIAQRYYGQNPPDELIYQRILEAMPYIVQANGINAPAQQARPADPGAQKRQDHLKRGATALSNRRGSIAPPEQKKQRAQNPSERPGMALVRELRKGGQID